MHTIQKYQITEWSVQIVKVIMQTTKKKCKSFGLFVTSLTSMNHYCYTTRGIYSNLSKFSYQSLNFPCLGGVEREEAEVYKSAHLYDGISGRVLCACAGLTPQDAAAVATVAAAAMDVNEWSHWSVRTFMIIIFTNTR